MPTTPASRLVKASTISASSLTRNQQGKYLIAALIIILPLGVLLGLSHGAIALSLSDVFSGLQDALLTDGSSQNAVIIGQIRLPRVLLAAVIGANLGICGAATQGLFRNPLADPSLIGVTAGASLGAALIIVMGSKFTQSQGYLGLSLVSAGAFIGGVIAVLFVYRLANSRNGTSVATMLLAGIAITALAGALGSLLEFFADNTMLRRISLWKMGGLDGANYPRLWVASVVTTMVLLALPRYSSALNALLLGESEARHLGVDVNRVKVGLIIWVAIGVGTSVAMVGTIAFVGLVIPHIVRMIIGPNHHYLLPASALAGAVLLLMADTLSRTLIAPTELPVGIITAIIGVPFFISLLRNRHHYGMQG